MENLGGHKLPTAYPSRRAWIHVSVRDRNHRTVFESGALNPDGSIQGNDNDCDPARFEPHYDEIDSQQVEIYESIMKDHAGHVTTGLLSAIGYVKDNRLLPRGFNKGTAEKILRFMEKPRTTRILPETETTCSIQFRLAMRKARFKWRLSFGINRLATAGPII